MLADGGARTRWRYANRLTAVVGSLAVLGIPSCGQGPGRMERAALTEAATDSALITGAAAGSFWSQTPTLLHPRSAHALVSTPTSLYALAGTSAFGTPVLPVERFDASTTTWSLETTLPGDGLN